MALGAVQGAGLGGVAADVLSGDTDWRRGALQAVAAAAPATSAFSKAWTMGQRVLASGLVSGIVGQIYDLVTGDGADTLPDAALRAAEDVATGAIGQGLSETATGVTSRRLARRQAGRLPPEEQTFRREFAAEEGIPLSASGITGSKGVARVESVPLRVAIGGRKATAFYDRQLQATEASLEKHLQRIDALSPDSSPTAAGDLLQQEIPQIAASFREAADLGFGMVRQSFRPGVSSEVVPDTLVSTAREIVRMHRRAPYPSPVPAGRIAARNTAPVPTAPALLSPLGKAITIQQIARDPRPMTYETARHYLVQLGARAFKEGQPIVGTVDDGLRKQLWKAMNADIEAMLVKHPEASETYSWMKRGYQETVQALNRRLDPLARTLDVEQVVPRLFKPGALRRTEDTKKILPREVFDRGAAATAQAWQRASLDKDGRLDSRKLADRVRPYAESGQLDVMFDEDTAGYFKRLVRFEPGLKSTERLAGNPSGTTQAAAAMAQLGALGTAALNPGSPLALKGAAGAVGVPWALSQAFSRPGIGVLTALANQDVMPGLLSQALPPLSRLAAQGLLVSP
jgi:hypothetical protein